MTTEKSLLEVTPVGMEIIDRLRQTRDEPPASVIIRALTVMGAVQKYFDGDSLFVRDPSKPAENDLVELHFQPQRH